MKNLNVVWFACVEERVKWATIHTKLSTYNINTKKPQWSIRNIVTSYLLRQN